MSNGCPGYEFNTIGVSACKIDVDAELGTSFVVNFTVFDNGLPPLASSILRTITIISPCGSDYLCDDGECSSVECDTRETLGSGSTLKEGPKIMLYPGFWKSNWTAGEGANFSLAVLYKEARPQRVAAPASGGIRIRASQPKGVFRRV